MPMRGAAVLIIFLLAFTFLQQLPLTAKAVDPSLESTCSASATGSGTTITASCVLTPVSAGDTIVVAEEGAIPNEANCGAAANSVSDTSGLSYQTSPGAVCSFSNAPGLAALFWAKCPSGCSGDSITGGLVVGTNGGLQIQAYAMKAITGTTATVIDATLNGPHCVSCTSQADTSNSLTIKNGTTIVASWMLTNAGGATPSMSTVPAFTQYGCIVAGFTGGAEGCSDYIIDSSGTTTSTVTDSSTISGGIWGVVAAITFSSLGPPTIVTVIGSCTFSQLQCWWYPLFFMGLYSGFILMVGTWLRTSPRGKSHLFLSAVTFGSLVAVIFGIMNIAFPLMMLVLNTIIALRLRG